MGKTEKRKRKVIRGLLAVTSRRGGATFIKGVCGEVHPDLQEGVLFLLIHFATSLLNHLPGRAGSEMQ